MHSDWSVVSPDRDSWCHPLLAERTWPASDRTMPGLYELLGVSSAWYFYTRMGRFSQGSRVHPSTHVIKDFQMFCFDVCFPDCVTSDENRPCTRKLNTMCDGFRSYLAGGVVFRTFGDVDFTVVVLFVGAPSLNRTNSTATTQKRIKHVCCCMSLLICDSCQKSYSYSISKVVSLMRSTVFPLLRRWSMGRALSMLLIANKKVIFRPTDSSQSTFSSPENQLRCYVSRASVDVDGLKYK